MGDFDTEYDLDTLTSMLDSDEETTENFEKKENVSNGNNKSAPETEAFENEEDLNTLADLMEDDDMDSLTLETNKSSAIPKVEESTNLSAAELGLELSDDEEKETTKNSGKSSFGTAFADSKFAPKNKNQKVNNVDPLEKELQEMENRMKLLKDQLKKKKRMDSDESKPSFTKLTNVVDSPNQSVRTLSQNESSKLYNKLQRGSEIHKGDTDSEDDEDNRNPFEQNYNSYGSEIKQRIAHDEHKNKLAVIDKNTAILDRVKRINDTITIKKTQDSNSKAPPMPVPNLNAGWKNVNGSLVGLKNPTNPSNYEDASIDPFSGIRVSNPLIAAGTMKERMEDRKMVRMSTITLHMRGGEIEGDWVTIGVVVDKSPVKTSQKGSQYSIWTLSDLKDCTKTVSLFLFASAHKDLWKTSVGCVIGILNPDIMKDREGSKSKDLVSLSVNYQQKVMIIGTAKDLGWCKGTNRQQGSKCRNFVNKNSCEFCMYHVQAEYKKTTAKRSDIQSSFSGVAPKSLQQKILGKGEVFYGGQSYSAMPSEPPVPKLVRANKAKDSKMLNSLGSIKTKLLANELKEEDRKDLFLLKHMTEGQVQAVRELSTKNESFTERLLVPTPGARNLIQFQNKEEVKKKEDAGEITSISAKDLLKMTHRTVVKEKKMKASERLLLASPSTRPSLSSFSPRSDGPKLGRGLNPGQDFDLDITFSPPTKGDMAKARAVALLKHKGGIQATSPNAVRNKNKSSDPKFQESVRKRVLETSFESDDGNNNPSKRSRLSELSSGGEDSPSGSPRSKLGKIDVNSEKFKAMMEKSSKHTNLISAVEDEAMDKYYNNLEKKEMLEEKMNSIMEIPVNAVACTTCKYLAESASDFCKSERHPLKTIKVKKRFFECKNCKRRTSSLDKLPRKACGGCEGTSWQRCAMGRPKKGPKLSSEILSLRGNEQSSYSGSSEKIYLHI